MKYGLYFMTPIGRLGIVETDGKITAVFLTGENIPGDVEMRETPLIKEAVKQINLYLRGDLKKFDLPVYYEGSDFKEAVWEALTLIEYGKTSNYKEIAISIGRPKAARAVGMANNSNPLPILIPCHRVIGSNGKLIGYRGGLELKKKLLEIEMN